IVAARNRPDEIRRVLGVLAAGKPGAADAARDRLVLALARRVRRSGGRLPVDPAGTTLVGRMVRPARMGALGPRQAEAVLLDAIDVLGTIDPEGSRGVLVDQLAPQRSLAVQVAAVRAMAEDRDADVPGILLPRLRAFEPSVRSAAIRTLLGRVDWTKALLRAMSGAGPNGVSPSMIEPAHRAPLGTNRD